MENQQEEYTTIKRLIEYQHKDFVRFKGYIKEINVKTTMRGDSVAILIVADESSEIETFMFPDVYESYRAKIKNDLFVEVTGRLQTEDDGKRVILAETIC